ncbi:MAG: IPT/TIG domain-containing protein [Acidimicrobiales bacterium]
MSTMKRAALVMAVAVAALGVGTLGTAGVASATKPKVPAVTSIAPDHGPVAGGTLVEIRGTNLGGVTGVLFGTTPSASVIPGSQREISAYSPPGVGTVDITVTTGSVTSATVPADEFTYVTTPSIQSVRPRAGTTLGGNRVTIAGSGFIGATAVSFGSVAATSFTVQSDQEILAISPAEPAGDVNVSVTTPNGTTPVDPADVYGFSLDVPIVTSVAPDFGPTSGGTVVTITGKRFTHVQAVDFGSTQLAPTSYSVTNGKTITAVAPPGVGTVDVTVTNLSGTSAINSPVDQFTYQTPGS